jgi:amino acid transporter
MTSPAAPRHLQRRLGYGLLVTYGVGTIVGAGIYVLVGQVIDHAGATAPLSFLIAGGLAALTGLSYAELSSRYPEAAGAAAYVAHGLGSANAARVTGLAAALVGTIGAASIARGCAVYLRHFIDAPEPLLAAAVIVLFAGIACLNVKQSVAVAAIHSAVEVGGLLLVIAIGAPAFAHLGERLPSMVPRDLAAVGGTLSGAFLAFFAYAGFETMVNMSEETHEPRRTMPRAIVGALAIAGVLYTLAVLVVLLGVAPDKLAQSETPLALVIGDVEWNAPAVIAAIAVFATANGVLVEVLMVSRLLFGMAERGWAPRYFRGVSTRGGVPLRATLVAALTALALAVSAPIEPLAEATSSALLALFGTVNLALWRLHRRPDRTHTGFRAPRWAPPLGCVLSFAMIPAQFLA